jgi:ribosome-associated translation inhibitor RaiA
MQVAPEVIFKDIDRTRWAEGYVSERLEHLEKFSPDITRCHVTVAREQGSHRKGNRYSVMVEVRIPRQHDLAVRKQKQLRHMPTQLPAIINEAFGAIEKRLKKTVARRSRATSAGGRRDRGRCRYRSDHER